MMNERSRVTESAAVLGVALAIALLPISAAALNGTGDATARPAVASPILSAAAAATPAQLEDRQGYDSSYLFSLSRGLAHSTVVTPLKPPLFIFTIPLDIALLPFAAIAGFF